MSTEHVGNGEYLKYRGITERSKSLLFLLREAPYITARDTFRFFYPHQKTPYYSRVMMRVLLRLGAVEKRLIGFGVPIYFLTEQGHRLTEFFLDDAPKFHSGTKSFYYRNPPRKPSEAVPFFFFPTHGLEFQRFTLHAMHSHPYEHTASLLELFVLLRSSFRFLHVLWLDQVRNKKTDLGIPCHPDLLLCNNLATEKGRVYIELENSRIHPFGLKDKLHNLTAMPADWYLFLCTSNLVFQSLGQRIRRIVLGQVKNHQKTIFFSARAQAALSRNVLIGFWSPTVKSSGEIHRLKDVDLYRYDDPIFDGEIWVEAKADGITVRDPQSGLPLKKKMVVPYPSRKPGSSHIHMGDLMNAYMEEFRTALDNALAEPDPPDNDHKQKGAPHDHA